MQMAFNCPFLIDTQGKGGVLGAEFGGGLLFQFKNGVSNSIMSILVCRRAA